MQLHLHGADIAELDGALVQLDGFLRQFLRHQHVAFELVAGGQRRLLLLHLARHGQRIVLAVQAQQQRHFDHACFEQGGIEQLRPLGRLQRAVAVAQRQVHAGDAHLQRCRRRLYAGQLAVAVERRLRLAGAVFDLRPHGQRIGVVRVARLQGACQFQRLVGRARLQVKVTQQQGRRDGVGIVAVGPLQPAPRLVRLALRGGQLGQRRAQVGIFRRFRQRPLEALFRLFRLFPGQVELRQVVQRG